MTGRNSGKIVTLNETQIKGAIKRALNEAWMTLDGRRESTNVEDRRGEPVDYLAAMKDTLNKLWQIEMVAMMEGQVEVADELQGDRQVMDAVKVLNGFYQKAQQVMGSFKQKVGMQLQNVVPKIAKSAHTGMPVQEDVGQAGTPRLSVYGMAYKSQFIMAATQFAKMVKVYIQMAQGGKMNPWKAFRTIEQEYKAIMVYSPIQQAQ